MLSFWQGIDRWQRRFAEHSTRVGNSLVFEISEDQKKAMENTGDLNYQLYHPKDIKYEMREDGSYDCTVTYDDLDNKPWFNEWLGFEDELMDYLNELN